MKQIIKLSENDLKNLISKSVSWILEDIDINPKNKDKFKRTQERTGKSTDELCHSKNPLTRKRANFAKMAKRHWKPLNESFAEQWEDEIKIFMKGLEKGQALVDNGYVAVEWGHSDNDPRYIYYKEGEDRLTDDHFSQQHSRRLYWDEISKIRDCAKQIYGVDIYIPDDEYYEEIYDEEELYENIKKRRYINESFKSNELRNWFKLHGGVKKTFEKEGYPQTNVRQDALGDISDEDITYLEEFPSFNEASEKMRTLKKPEGWKRSQHDMQSYFTIYRANDGMCLLVGIDRNNIDLGVTWGGEISKKGADRYWRDEHSPFPYWKTNKYTDDKDTYYYSRKGQDFGLRTNRNFKGKMSDNEKIRDKMSDKEWKNYQKNRVKDMKDYLSRH